MTYSAHETSIHDGAPVELYEFSYAPLLYYYTSSDESVTLGSVVYETAAIVRGHLEQTSEIKRQSLKLTVPRSFPVALLFQVSPPAQPVLLTVKRLHRADNDEEVVVLWSGWVVSCGWGELTATLICDTVWSAVRRPALKRSYQRSCPHVLYKYRCGVVDSAYLTPATLSNVNSVELTATVFGSQVDGYYSGGRVEWQDSTGVLHHRYITDHVGAVITINQPFVGLAIGGSVVALPGCDHTLTTCDSKFNNAVNFGGFPWIPTKNPMGGSKLF